MGRRRFQQEAGDAAEGVVFPLLYDPRQEGTHHGDTENAERNKRVAGRENAAHSPHSPRAAFRAPYSLQPPCSPCLRGEDLLAKTFTDRFERPPDYAAAHTYDAVRLLVAAIRKAGMNRARIRDALKELSPFSGVTGAVHWDPLGSNTRPVSLGTIQEGRVVPAGADYHGDTENTERNEGTVINPATK